MNKEAESTNAIVYNQKSCAYCRDNFGGNGIALIVIGLLCGAMFVWCWTLAPGGFSRGLPNFLMLEAMALAVVLLGVWFVIPWQFKLDYLNRNYEYVFGHQPLCLRRAGSFAEIKGIYGFISAKTNNFNIAVRIPGHKIWIETYTDVDEGLRRKAGLSELLGIQASVVVNREKRISKAGSYGADAQTYTLNSTKYGREASTRRTICLVGILILYIVCCAPVLFEHSSTARSHLSGAIAMFVFITLGYVSWVVPIVLLRSMPWELSLDYGSKKYRLDMGFWPFVRTRRGSLEDFTGIRVVEMGGLSSDEPYLISIMSKTKGHFRRFEIEASATREQADSRLSEMREIYGLPIVDAWGRPVTDQSISIATDGEAAYTDEEMPRTYAKRRIVTEMIVKFVLPVAFIPVITYNPVPGRHVGLSIFWLILGACWFLAALNYAEISPWRLDLDYLKGEYNLWDGFEAVRLRRSGPFSQIRGVCVISMLGMFSYDPYVIAIAIRIPFRTKYYRVKTAQRSMDAKKIAATLAESLGVKVIDPPKQS